MEDSPEQFMEKDVGTSNSKDARSEQHPFREGATFCGIKFAPFDLPWERRLQTLATFLLITWFMGGWMVTIYIFYRLLCSRLLFWIPLLYFAWLYLDFNQHNRGGRRFHWIRELWIYSYWCDYFPVSLIKTHDLPAERNYLFGYHPHGIAGVGALCSFLTEALDFSDKFPGITVHLLTTRLAYIWPVAREFFMALGASNASKENIKYITQSSTGNAIVLVVGGASESMEARPGGTRLVLKNRKGFIKMALRTGACLVPVYGFGENNLFEQLIPNPPGSLIRRGQRWLQKRTGIVPVFFIGRGLANYTVGWMPRRHPIHVVVGKPLAVTQIAEPSEVEIDSLHLQYLDALTELFDSHKGKYGYGGTNLEFI